MKQCIPGAMAVLILGISGCSTLLPAPEVPQSRLVNVNGETYSIRQMTEGTWTASATGSPGIFAETSARTAYLLQAVETVSGCRVTDSDYSRQGTQFDAQVICAGRLRN